MKAAVPVEGLSFEKNRSLQSYNPSDVKASAKPFVNRSGGKHTDSDLAVRTYLMMLTDVLANTLLIATGIRLSDSRKQ